MLMRCNILESDELFIDSHGGLFFYINGNELHVAYLFDMLRDMRLEGRQKATCYLDLWYRACVLTDVVHATHVTGPVQ